MNKYFSPLKNIEELHLEMGYKCNLRCSMCFQKGYDQAKMLAPQIWQKKLLPVYPHLKRLILQGGEPTIIKECKEVISLAKSLNPELKLGMVTNGVFFDQAWQEEFTANGFMVNFSLNANDQETYDKICKFGNFEKVLSNLESLLALKKEKNSNLKVFISFVILPENAHQLAAFAERGHKLGVDKIRFFFDDLSLKIQPEIFLEQTPKTLDLLKKYGYDLAYNRLMIFYKYYCQNNNLPILYQDIKINEQVKKFCPAPWKSIYINPHGKVFVCCMSSLVLGDLNKQNFSQIWNNAKAKKFRKKILNNDYRYCQLNCLDNKNPKYHLTLSKLRCYWDKFLYVFKSSPKAAFAKAWRKIKKSI